MVRPGERSKPILAGRRDRAIGIDELLDNDPTNWWTPTAACLESWLRAAGLEVERLEGVQPSEYPVWREGERAGQPHLNQCHDNHLQTAGFGAFLELAA
jgi:hypothetical protein